MGLHDKIMPPCVTCGDEFIFTVGEQLYHKDKGYPEPKRCFVCRRKLRAKKRKAIKQMEKRLKTAENVEIKLVDANGEKRLPLMKSRNMTTVSIAKNKTK